MKDNLRKPEKDIQDSLSGFCVYNTNSNHPGQVSAYPAIPLKDYQLVSCLGWIAGQNRNISDLGFETL
jgi:hypothetical protein